MFRSGFESVNVDYTNWYNFVPTNYYENSCVYMYLSIGTSGSWVNTNCGGTATRHYICSHEGSTNTWDASYASPTLAPTASAVDPKYCPPDYHYSEQLGECFKYVDTRRTWNAARNDCMSSYHGNLLEIPDAAKNAKVYNLFKVNTDTMWIGFNFDKNKQSWSW